ncbi:MAG: pectate lyase [Sedimentisphaerales bacterium]|jgi:PelA/Pel-15E family pectate lyase
MMNKKIILLAVSSVFFCFVSYALAKPDNKANEIDTSDFYSDTHHWYDIFDAQNVINPEPNQPRYKPAQIKEIADNVLLYQRDNGGWPKNYDMQAILTPEQHDKVLKAKSALHTTFDNSTTYTHIKYLAQAYQILGDEKYKDACLRGIDFTLSAQYPNGGWPQFFPLESNYSRRITFNDDAMTGVMVMLKDIIDNKPYYSFVDSARREKVKVAFDKGLSCILKCQIIDNGTLTAWCQQHDEVNLAPAWARAYEPPSICSKESANIILLLMGIDKPGPEVIKSVTSAVKWFEDSKLKGIRFEEFNAPEEKFPLRTIKTDRRVVEDKSAPPIWARFYELGTHRPLFSNRKSEFLYSLAEVDRERRASYGWYAYEPQTVLDQFPAWQKKWTAAQK